MRVHSLADAGASFLPPFARSKSMLTSDSSAILRNRRRGNQDSLCCTDVSSQLRTSPIPAFPSSLFYDSRLLAFLLSPARYDELTLFSSQYPIRREMQGSVFGAPYWKNERLMNGEIFPVHGKGMNKLRLTAPLQRFIAFVRTELDQLAVKIDSSPAAETTLNLGDWIAKVFFEASLTGMFGSNVLDAQGTPMEEFYQACLDFDAAFPIEASGMVPPALLPFIPDVKKGRKAREVISSTFTAWISGGFEGLEEGVIRDMANIALENDLGVEEAGKVRLSPFFVLPSLR